MYWVRQASLNHSVDLFRSPWFLISMHYEQHMAMWQTTLLPLHHSYVSSHATQYISLQKLVMKNAKLQFEKARNQIWTICRHLARMKIICNLFPVWVTRKG